MENINWLRQTTDKPAFPDVLWSRPVNKRHAGKLLIIGGHKQSFNGVSEAFSAAQKAGIGTVRVILPDSLQKMLKTLFPEAEFAPSTSIGSFSRQALDVLLTEASWADSVLLAGDFGHNSETAILLESFVEKYSGLLAIGGDTTEYFFKNPDQVLQRPNTLVICNLGNLQKLAQTKVAIKQTEDLMQILSRLSVFTAEVECNFVTYYEKQIIVASSGKISTTQKGELGIKEERLAAYASVWWLQQPEKTFDALTTAAYSYE